ncbi:hypothetical protein RYX36_001178, partial [Vicia faba]
MRISYTSNRFLLFIIFTACLCLFFAIQKKKPTHLNKSSKLEIPTNNYSSLSGLKLDKLPNEDEVLKLFQQWKKQHGRVYNGLEEMAKKFDTFVTNLKYIVESNAKRESPHSAVLGLNKFADWSFEEFKETYINMNDDDSMEIVMNDDVDDSTSFEWVIGNEGVALESDYNYTAVKGTICKASQIQNSPFSAINSFNHVNQSEEGLLCAVVKQPIKVSFHVTRDFKDYTH